jgi:glycosyltransferase involved in cell wall biosynthesis
MTYIVEPYVFWKGHYRQYFENLLGKENTLYVYCSATDRDYDNSKYLKFADYDYEKNFLSFIFSRISNSYRAIKYVNNKIQNNDTVYFLEFEPFSALLFSIFNKNMKIRIIQTVHSVERLKYANKFKDIISQLQRFVFKKSLIMLNKFDTTFVVHYKYHHDALENFFPDKKNIKIIDYPSPDVKIETIQPLSPNKSLLIFGLVREDKGIYEFLKEVKGKGLEITVAGKVLDSRVYEFKDSFHFIDRFIEDDEIAKLYETHDFALIPYWKDYTGGAGPLKDALSYGKPVFVSKHRVFEDLVSINNLGFIYKDIGDLQRKLYAINNDTYEEISQNCLTYAKRNTWTDMRNKYFSLVASEFSE